MKLLFQKVKALEGELSGEERASELPQHLKQKITDEILQRLRSLNPSDKNTTTERGTCLFFKLKE